MCPCNPVDFPIPTVSSGPNIPGFGSAFSPQVPDLKLKLPNPPDLSGLFKLLSFPLPAGELKSPLNPNFGKDIIDGIIKLLDQFMPFLMFYKFFLPVLKLLLCILEIFCALPNPIKTAEAIQKLFRDCIPSFLSLFPFLAIILMIAALILLLIQLIIYLITLVINLILLIVRNINILIEAFSLKDENAVLKGAEKIGRILCLFQNLFIVLLMVDLIFNVFKDILNLAFAIPPCDNDESVCCSPDVCPQFIKNGNFDRFTGELKYIAPLSNSPNLPGLDQSLIDSLGPFLSKPIREESFQFFDDGTNTSIYQQFINMINAYDVKISPKPVFYPTDSTYSATTPPSQAPYTLDIRVFYKPSDFGRLGEESRFIKFKDCIVTKASVSNLIEASGSTTSKSTGVIKISGGTGYEDDGETKLVGYNKSTGEKLTEQDENTNATLENFLFLPSKNVVSSTAPLPNISGQDFIDFSNIEYTFKINHPILASKNIITFGCMPAVAQDKTATNELFTKDINIKLAQLKDFPWPNVQGAIDCMNLGIDTFRNNVTVDGANVLKTTLTSCLEDLRIQAENAINVAIPLAFDKYKSTFSVDPDVQFTTSTIKIKVDLKESSGSSLIKLLPQGSADYIANKIKADVSFGQVSEFKYDGSNYFEAEISSNNAGSGSLQISFESNYISDISPGSGNQDLTVPLSVSIRELPYQFIYASSEFKAISIGTGDASDGESPRRNESDVANS